MGTITKALSLLNCFSEQTPEIGLTEFCKLTGRDKATLHRHLVELEANGFLEQHQVSRKYRLGAALLRLAAVRELIVPARRIVSQWVDKLADELGELVHASMVQGDGMSPIYFHDGGWGGTRVYFSEAEVLPLHATASGIAALAFGPPGLLARIGEHELKAFTEHTMTDHETLLQKVSETRSQGYSETDQSYEAEICSLAVPFYEEGEHAIGTVAIAMPQSRMARSDKHALVSALFDTSRRITREFGGTLPEDLKQAWRSAA